MMKKITFLISLNVVLLQLLGQTTWVGQSSNTWYVVAPTSGCNGVWALNTNQWVQCPFSGTYTMSPAGCATAVCGPVTVDTMYLSLCAVPCSIIAQSNGSAVQVCNTGTPQTSTIESIKKKNLISIYPNPASQILNIQIKDLNGRMNSNLKIVNIIGEEWIAEEIRKSDLDIDISALPNGLYFLKITNGGKDYSTRIIIEH